MVMSSPSKRDRALADRMLADERVEQAGLADAVAAEHAGDLAGLRRERHAAQRLRRAVVQIDGVDVEHRPIAPDRLRPRARSVDTWSIVPSASTEPSCRHVTLTPSSRTKAMSCSTTTTVRSRLISLSSSAVCRVSASVMPATGSSTSRSFGSCASSMPISSHCFCPCDRLPATRSRSARQPHDLQDAVDAAVVLGVLAPEQGRARPAVALEREQEVVLDRVHLEHGRLLELAADAELGDLGLVELGEVVRAVESTSPSSGRVLPVTTSIMVVLPAPFGPMMARISPGSTASDRLLSALKPSNETVTPLR